MPTDFVQQFLINAQHEFAGGFLVDTSFVHTHGTNLVFSTDIDQAPTSALGCTGYNCGNPNPVFNSIIAQNYDGWSNYNALQVRVQKRMSHGVHFLANYAWTKSMDTGTGNGHGSTIDIYQNAYRPAANYGLSDFNAASTLTGQVVYELPFGSGRQYALHGAADEVAGGWRVLDAEPDKGTPALSQQWRLTSNNDGYFRIASLNPGAGDTTNVLNTGGSAVSNSVIVQSPSGGGREQEWNIVSPVGSTLPRRFHSHASSIISPLDGTCHGPPAPPLAAPASSPLVCAPPSGERGSVKPEGDLDRNPHRDRAAAARRRLELPGADGFDCLLAQPQGQGNRHADVAHTALCVDGYPKHRCAMILGDPRLLRIGRFGVELGHWRGDPSPNARESLRCRVSFGGRASGGPVQFLLQLLVLGAES